MLPGWIQTFYLALGIFVLENQNHPKPRNFVHKSFIFIFYFIGDAINRFKGYYPRLPPHSPPFPYHLSFILQFVTQKDILGLKKRISRLEDANAPRLFEEDLPEPSLPRILRMKPAQSEAGHAKQQSSSTSDVILEDRKKKCSRIMSELKKMSEEIGRKRST